MEQNKQVNYINHKYKSFYFGSAGVLGLKKTYIELGSSLDLWLIKPDAPCDKVENEEASGSFLCSLIDLNSLSGKCLARIQKGIWELF